MNFHWRYRIVPSFCKLSSGWSLTIPFLIVAFRIWWKWQDPSSMRLVYGAGILWIWRIVEGGAVPARYFQRAHAQELQVYKR